MFFFFEFSGMQKMQRIAHGEKMLVLIFKAIKAINPSSISKSDLLASWVRAKTKDTVLILSDIGHYHSANKWKFSPFSSLKISTNPLLFCLHEFPFVLQSSRTVFFFCLLVLGFFCFFFWNRFFCLLLTEEAEDPISSKSWCCLRLLAAQARFTFHTLTGFNTLQSIRWEFLAPSTWKLFQVLLGGCP